MKLNIVSPFKTQKLDIAWIELNTPVGNMVIQLGHVPTIVTLEPDRELIFCLKSGKQESFVVKQGIAEVTRTDVTLLLNEEL